MPVTGMRRANATAMAEALLGKVGLIDKRGEYPARFSGVEAIKDAGAYLIANTWRGEAFVEYYQHPESLRSGELVLTFDLLSVLLNEARKAGLTIEGDRR